MKTILNVPILDRPEGRPQSAGASLSSTVMSASSNPRSPRRTTAMLWRRHHPILNLTCLRVPILDRPEGRPQLFANGGEVNNTAVPILDRPEGRPQLRLVKAFKCALCGFQSSIAPKDDRNLI